MNNKAKKVVALQKKWLKNKEKSLFFLSKISCCFRLDSGGVIFDIYDGKNY